MTEKTEQPESSRMSRMRNMQIGETISESKVMSEDCTTGEVKAICKGMSRSICSTINYLKKKQGMKFETATGAMYLSNGKTVCTLVIERIW